MNSTDTGLQYDKIIAHCKDIFIRKTHDYGTAWRVLRTISIVDQIFIKAQRIRTIQQKGVKKVNEDISGEFTGIINYAVIGLIQLQLKEIAVEDLQVNEVKFLYDDKISLTKNIMLDKNHDYGEAWREMSQESFVDLILMKLMRIRQILSNEGRTVASEGMDSNFVDIINYAVFGLILIEEGKHLG